MEEVHQVAPLTRLPVDVLIQIGSFLDIKSLTRLQTTCRSLKLDLSHHYSWRNGAVAYLSSYSLFRLPSLPVSGPEAYLRLLHDLNLDFAYTTHHTPAARRWLHRGSGNFFFGGQCDRSLSADLVAITTDSFGQPILTLMPQTGDLPGNRTSAGFLVSRLDGQLRFMVFGGLKEWRGGGMQFTRFADDTYVGEGTEEVVWRRIRTSVRPQPRWGHQLVSVGGRNFVFGGANQQTVLGDLWEFSQAGWSEISANSDQPMPVPRSGHGACAVTVRGISGACLFISGGNNQSETFSDCWIYAPSLDRWLQVMTEDSSRQLLPRIGHCAVPVTVGRVLLLGGRQLHPARQFVEQAELLDLDFAEDGQLRARVRTIATVAPRTGAAVVEIPGGLALVGGTGTEAEMDEVVLLCPSLFVSSSP